MLGRERAGPASRRARAMTTSDEARMINRLANTKGFLGRSRKKSRASGKCERLSLMWVKRSRKQRNRAMVVANHSSGSGSTAAGQALKINALVLRS